jgi:hypothetical protein
MVASYVTSPLSAIDPDENSSSRPVAGSGAGSPVTDTTVGPERYTSLRPLLTFVAHATAEFALMVGWPKVRNYRRSGLGSRWHATVESGSLSGSMLKMHFRPETLANTATRSPAASLITAEQRRRCVLWGDDLKACRGHGRQQQHYRV